MWSVSVGLGGGEGLYPYQLRPIKGSRTPSGQTPHLTPRGRKARARTGADPAGLGPTLEDWDIPWRTVTHPGGLTVPGGLGPTLEDWDRPWRTVIDPGGLGPTLEDWDRPWRTLTDPGGLGPTREDWDRPGRTGTDPGGLGPIREDSD